MQLRNIYDKQTLLKKIKEEPFQRFTLSFYRYVILEDADTLRNKLYLEFSELGVLGRIFLAREGVNAQISVPQPNYEAFIKLLYSYEAFNQVPVKKAVEEKEHSFLKLKIKVRKRILADGLDDNAYDVTNVGRHLTAEEFNREMEKNDAIIVDMRNHYESEVGHFKGAICPDSDTFREELPLVLDKLKGNEDKTVLMYCTGGIRCEKASAFLKHHGFKNVNQLYGGIIQYAQELKEKNLENKFIGKNFVFDERLGERISDEIIAQCHQCGAPCDNHTNCANEACHLLFIQCDTCKQNYHNCCTAACTEIALLPVDERKKIRKGLVKKDTRAVFKKGRVNKLLSETK